MSQKATKISLGVFNTPPMRAFHMAWLAFFFCFFAWFGIAPLMGVIRAELGLTQEQVGNTIIASVAATIFARLLVGWLCDHYGPRLTYTGLLVLGSLPVMGIGLAHSYESFLLFRLGIGVIGASFVITSYHTSIMFAPAVVGTANATAAGWGNLGGGVTQLVTPLLFAAFLAMGLGEYWSWRVCMLVAGLVCLVTAFAYWRLTQDSPAGNFRDLRRVGLLPPAKTTRGTFRTACRDPRSWVLALAYAACFGVEITLDNIAALYFIDYFGLGMVAAGGVAALFGMMNLFARALGGLLSDRCAKVGGLNARVKWLVAVLFCEGLMMMVFSRCSTLWLAVVALMTMGLFVKMSNGATYAVVPFINKKALGSVAGIVGAGGNVGAVLLGFLFKGSFSWPDALLLVGVAVCFVALATLAVRFSAAPAAVEETAAEAGLEPDLATEPARIRS